MEIDEGCRKKIKAASFQNKKGPALQQDPTHTNYL
jgi:hypothetical protein